MSIEDMRLKLMGAIGHYLNIPDDAFAPLKTAIGSILADDRPTNLPRILLSIIEHGQGEGKLPAEEQKIADWITQHRTVGRDKTTISNSYMEAMKRRHGSKPIPEDRHGVVFGSNRSSNIGSEIASRLRATETEDTFYIEEYDKDSCHLLKDIRHFDWNETDTVIFANGTTHLDWIEHQTAKTILDTVDDTLTSSIYGASEFVQATIDKPFKKHIVFIGSMAYRNVLNASAPYCAAKAGLAHFARCLAWELAPKGYDVFCVHPSNTEGTPMTEETIQGIMRYRNVPRAEAEAYWAAVLPKTKWLQTENIAEVVAFLVSGKASYLSGCNLDLAGGQR